MKRKVEGKKEGRERKKKWVLKKRLMMREEKRKEINHNHGLYHSALF
jgi:hypothetical protein